MGYSGMQHIFDSDRSADMMYNITDKITVFMNSYLVNGFEETNCYNTDPHEDIGLFFKDVIVPAAKNSGVFLFDKKMCKIACEVLKGLEEKIKLSKKHKKEWEPDNLNDHLKDWRSMIRSIKWFIGNSR